MTHQEDVADLILFVSRSSQFSHKCKALFQHRAVPVITVHLDQPDVRRRVLQNSSFTITHVPTLLLVYQDQTASKIEGLDDIQGWIDQYYPDQPQVEEEEQSTLLTPSMPSRRDGSPSDPKLGKDEGFEMLDSAQFKQDLFDDDVIFQSPTEIQSQGPPRPALVDSNKQNIHQMADEMKSSSGLNYDW